MKRSTLIYLLLGFVGFGVLFILYKELTKEPSAKPNVPSFVDPDEALHRMRLSTTKPKDVPQFKSEGTLYIHKKKGIDTLDLELANSEGQRALGLMWRDSLPKNSAMLFIFDAEEPLSFWMKNCFFPQDMLFVGKDKTIKKIVYNALPMGGKVIDDEEQPHYPDEPVNGQYVVELEKGMVQQKNIQIGDTINFSQK